MIISDFKVHHIGVAVADMKSAIAVYEANGYLCSDPVFDPIQNVNISFAEKPDELRAELLEPAGEKSPVSDILKKSGGEPEVYHICYSVPDVEQSVADLRKARWLLVKPPVPAVACGNAKVAFLYSGDGGLIELLEEKS